MKSGFARPKFPWYPLAAFVLLTLGLIGLGYFYYTAQSGQIKTDKENELSEIADLKVAELAGWRQERVEEAKGIMNNAFLARTVRQWLQEKQNRKLERDLYSRISSIQRHYHYELLILLDAQGRTQLSAQRGVNIPESHHKSAVPEVIRTKTYLLQDLHRGEQETSIHLDMFVPLLLEEGQDTTVAGILVLRMDAYRSLYPLVEKWPVASRTAETILLRREGDDVVFLSELRHRPSAALSMRLPISRPKLPAAIAARGYEGVVEGIDYRGVPVLAVTRAIPNSPWFLVAKVDQEEIYTPIHQQARLVGSFVGLLILATAASFFAYWRGQTARFYQQQYRAELERRAPGKHFEYLIKYANDIIVLADEQKKIIEVNDRALAAYGYSRDEMLQMNLKDLGATEARESFDAQFKEVVEQNGLAFETVHHQKDGTKFPVEVSSRVIEVEGKKFYQSIIRDISERKRSEQALQESEKKYRSLADNALVGVYRTNLKGEVLYVNETVVRMAGFESAAEVKNFGVLQRYKNPEDRKRLLDALRRTGHVQNFEVDLLTKSGETRNALVSATLEGDVISGIVLDITDRKRAEDALRESEERFTAFMNNSPIVAWLKDPATWTYCYINNAFERVFNITRDVIAKKTDFDLWPEGIAKQLRQNDFKVISSGKTIQTFEDVPLPDGTVHHWLVFKFPLHTRTGKCLLAGTAVDITERKRAEEAVRESEERFRSLAEYSPNMIFINRGGRVIFANEKCEELMGYRREEFYSPEFDFMSLIAPESWQAVMDSYRRQLKGEEIPPYECTLVTKEGKKLIGIHNTKLINYDGSAEILGIVTDITERKLAEQRLADERNLLRTLIDNLPDLIFVKDCDGRFVAANNAVLGALGVNSEKDVIGKTDFDFFEKKLAQQYHADELEILHTGRLQIAKEEPFVDASGAQRWMSATKVPLRDAAGKIIGLVGMNRDITDSKRAEEALRQSEERFRLLAESSLTGIYLIQDQKFAYVNESLASTFGRTVDEIIGKLGLLDLTHPDDRPRVLEHIHRRVRGEVDNIRYDFKGLKKDGSVIYLEVHGRRIEYAGKVGIIGTLLDISERKRAEQEREVLYNIAEDVNTTTNLNELLKSVHGNIKKVMYAENCYIALYDSKTETVSFPFFLDQFDETPLPRAKRRGLTEYVLRTGKPLLLTDELYDQLVKNNEVEPIGTPPKSWLGVPLVIQPQPFGVLAVQSYEPGQKYTDRDKELLSAIGHQAALAIERKRAEEEIKTLAHAIRSVGECISVTDLQDRILFVNEAFLKTYGYKEEELIGKPISVVRSPEHPPERAAEILPATMHGGWHGELWNRRKDGTEFPIALSTYIISDENGEPEALIGVATDISERKRAEVFQTRLGQVLEAIAADQELPQVLEKLVRAIEEYVPDIKASVLLFDAANQCLRHGAAPSLPADYNALVDGLRIGPAVGSCGTAAYRRQLVVVEDIQTDPLWADYREVAARYNLRACWSQPIMNPEGEVLGTLALYYAHPHHPNERELKLIDTAGHIAGVAINRDRAKQALLTSEAKYRSLFHNVLEGIYQSTPDGRVLTANPALVRMLGYESEEELKRADIGRDLYANPADRTAFIQKLQELGSVKNLEVILKRKDGARITVLESAHVVRGQKGDVVYYEGTLTDITERKRAEEMVQTSREWLKAMFNASRDGIVVEEDGKIVYANMGLARIYGYDDPEELLEEEASILVSEADLPRTLEYKRKRLNGEIAPSCYEFKGMRKNGISLDLEASLSVFSIGGKKYVISLIRDISDRRKLQQQLIQAQKMESIGTLAGGIAHDFNNILGVVLGYASMLQSTDADQTKTSRHAEAIVKAAERGARLIQQLLTFARKTDMWTESVRVNEVIKDLVKLLQETFPRTITYSVQLDENIPSVSADVNQLHQALLNLAINARDAILANSSLGTLGGTAGGTISLRTRLVSGDTLRQHFSEAHEEQYVAISVGDNGIGMTEEIKSRLFEPFFTTKERGKGTGLGLSVVYGIVKGHQGFIDVESEPGGGSTFHLYLPILALHPKAFVRDRNLPAEAPGGSETVLVIEDEAMLLDLLKNTLEGKGYEVLTASDGVEGVEVYRQHQTRIATVLMDVGLPGLDGREVLAHLFALNPSVKVILASGYIDPNLKSELYKAGAKHFVQKPYVPAEILSRIREVLDHAMRR